MENQAVVSEIAARAGRTVASDNRGVITNSKLRSRASHPLSLELRLSRRDQGAIFTSGFHARVDHRLRFKGDLRPEHIELTALDQLCKLGYGGRILRECL